MYTIFFPENKLIYLGLVWFDHNFFLTLLETLYPTGEKALCLRHVFKKSNLKAWVYIKVRFSDQNSNYSASMLRPKGLCSHNPLVAAFLQAFWMLSCVHAVWHSNEDLISNKGILLHIFELPFKCRSLLSKTRQAPMAGEERKCHQRGESWHGCHQPHTKP